MRPDPRVRTIRMICLSAAFLAVAHGGLCQMKDPAEWVNYGQVLGVNTHLHHYDYEVLVVHSSAPANILWPGEQPVYTVQVVNNLGEPVDAEGRIDIIRYGSRGRPDDVWLPEMIKLADEGSLPVQVHIPANGYTNLTVAPVIPPLFGGYALVLDLGKYGRRLVTSLVRTFAAAPESVQFPKQSLDDMGSDFLQRVGVQAIRMGVDYTPTSSVSYVEKMEALDKKLQEYHRKNITVLLMFGAGDNLMPLGTPRSFLDSGGVMLNTKQDYVWLPSLDSDFKVFVHRLCTRYGWPAGPVTAVSLWNEPWEGISISGWQSDMLRYREIYRSMADAVVAARKEGADVLVGGGDSNSNAWDKLFADGKMTFLPVFDFCSIHYQGMESPALYPEWLNRKSPRGRVKIWDTESWVGNTDDRIGLVVATNRSAGYDRSMGIYAGYMYSGGRGDEHFTQNIHTPQGMRSVDRVAETWSPTAAMGAVQHLLGERDFKELLFTNGLPWVMLFDGLHGHEDDGTIAVIGDIGEAFGPENVLFRGVHRSKDARMSLRDNPAFRLYDFYGNEVPPVKGQLTVPLNSSGYFLRTDGSRGSFPKLVAAVRQARIEGYEPVEIIARDMTRRIGQHPVLELKITNILNRPVKGRLAVTLGKLSVGYPESLQLAPHETKEIPVRVAGGEPVMDNTYALAVQFDGPDGHAAHQENMHVNVISKRAIDVDGKLDDWKDVLPQIISGKGGNSVSVTEAAWYPFKNFDTSGSGYASGYLAYDDHYFYFASKTADKTPHPGAYRFADRPDDEFFYPDTAWKLDPNTSLVSVTGSKPVNKDDQTALQQPDGAGRVLNYWESGDNTSSYGFDLQLPDTGLARVSFYLPNLDVWKAQIDIIDGNSGNLLASHTVDNLWEGVHAVFALSGRVKVVIHSLGWWYAVKLAAVFIDTVQPGARGMIPGFLYEDLDTRGNWKGVYGSRGYCLAGEESHLPAGIRWQPLAEAVRQPLVWPAGVRHFSYRKDPVLPDNSGLGYSFDNVLIAFNVIPDGQDGLLDHPPGTMPRYTGYKCTDYEYALNQVAPQYGGGTEIWCLLRPGMNRKHFFPRQPKSPGEGPVTEGKLVIRRDGNTLITECAIPWTELPDVKKLLDQGRKIKFSFRVNDNGAPGSCMELAKERSVSKRNARAFHPDWKTHWANEVEFEFEK